MHRSVNDYLLPLSKVEGILRHFDKRWITIVDLTFSSLKPPQQESLKFRHFWELLFVILALKIAFWRQKWFGENFWKKIYDFSKNIIFAYSWRHLKRKNAIFKAKITNKSSQKCLNFRLSCPGGFRIEKVESTIVFNRLSKCRKIPFTFESGSK